MRFVDTLIGVAVLSLLGCAGAQPPPPVPRGNVIVVASNHVTAPFALRSITVGLDGEQEETTQGKSLQHPDSDEVRIGVMSVARGRHVLSVRTSAEDRSSDRVLSLATSQPLRIDSLPARIIVHVFTPQQGLGNDRRIELSFDVQGGAVRGPLGGVASEPSGTQRCAELAPVSAAICRTELAVEQARAARDPLLTVCVRDKLGQMKALLSSAEPGEQEPLPIPATRYDAEVARMASQRVFALERDLSTCAPTDLRAGVVAGKW